MKTKNMFNNTNFHINYFSLICNCNLQYTEITVNKHEDMLIPNRNVSRFGQLGDSRSKFHKGSNMQSLGS